MQAEYLKRRFHIKDDLHRLIGNIELSRSLKTEEKEVKDGPNQIEVKGYDKQTTSIEYKVSGQFGISPYIEYLEWKRLEGKNARFFYKRFCVRSFRTKESTIIIDYFPCGKSTP